MSSNINDNNVVNFREKLSEMDKIFIPEDTDENINMEDLVSYRHNVKFWKVVPENYSLVAKNIFTQRNRNIYGFGVKFLSPLFTKTILVPKYSGIKRYTNVKAYTEKGVELKVDFGIVMKITNPAKYMTEGKNQINVLNALITNLFKAYIFTKRFENVIQEECKLREFDPDGKLSDFARSYGITVEKVLIEKVELPEELKKLYNDEVEEEQRRKAQNIKMQADLEKAKNDADIAKINYDVKAEEIKALEKAKYEACVEKISKLAETLKKEGFSSDRIDEYIKTLILSENGNAIFMGGNQDAQTIATGVLGARVAADNQEDQDIKRSR